MPVLPSDIDIHAAAKCISDLLLIAKIRREDQRIAVIANRVKKNTLMYKSLMKFLETLQIPVITTLRDSQNYIRAAETGRGLFEMKPIWCAKIWINGCRWSAGWRSARPVYRCRRVRLRSLPCCDRVRLCRRRLQGRVTSRMPEPIAVADVLSRFDTVYSQHAGYFFLSLSQPCRTLSVQLL